MRHIALQFSNDWTEKYKLTYQDLKNLVIPLILDNSSKHEAPFSIHNIVEIGKEILQKGAGEWYGAHSISQVIRLVNDKYNHQYYKKFKIITFNEGVVYRSEINWVFENYVENNIGLLVIIPIRLGLNKIDKVYYSQIKSALSNRLSVGILGGKKSYAMYYVGYYDDKIISLDPHEEQDSIDELNDSNSYTYLTNAPKILSLSSCDTTMAFWFYLKDQADIDELFKTIEQWKEIHGDEWVISISDRRKSIDLWEKEIEFDDSFELV